MLQQTIENDEHIGGAIRDLKSALRGEDEPIRPGRSRDGQAARDGHGSRRSSPLAAPGTPEHGAMPDEPASGNTSGNNILW